jgi:NAD(P)-dependent dehydrogenase (short-subunit alcohol dehydrogenase family)
LFGYGKGCDPPNLLVMARDRTEVDEASCEQSSRAATVCTQSRRERVSPDERLFARALREAISMPTTLVARWVAASLSRKAKELTMSIDRKVAIITGASQGIGAALVNGYLDRNYRVIATARSVKPSNNPDVLVIPGDIGDRETAERAITEGVARFGRIDTLVNNAGIFIAKPFTQYTEADFTAVLRTNTAGFFHITQLALAEMEKQGSGHIVQITTSLVDHAIDGVPSVLASLTKGGLNAATKSLAIEYAKRGIRVNAVSPGIIKSSMHPVETHAAFGPLHPVGHMGEVSDIVEAVLYLETAGFVTGEILHVDGGQSAGH